MKILYKQPEQDRQSSLSHFGVQNCYFKKIYINRDHNNIKKKAHHHTGFELHIVTEGCQEYQVGETIYKLEGGCFLLIHPNVEHTAVACIPHTHKYSITFNKQTNHHADDAEHAVCFFGMFPKRIFDNIDCILNEDSLQKEISPVLIENNILEIIVSAFRLSGNKENDKLPSKDENIIISLAKKFIDDNIENSLNVTNVSEHCYLSTKQLTRIFQKFEGISPGEYIIKKRILRIEKLLADNTLSLRQISEIMNFNNEYYLNAFFKKYSGMPPGEYRKMMGK